MRTTANSATTTASSSDALDDALDLTATYRLSRFACLRPEGAGFVLENPFNSQRLAVHSPALFRLLLALTAGARPADLLASLAEPQRGLLRRILDQCHASALLTRVGPDGVTDEDQGPLAPWSVHDLFFHTHSRPGRHAAPVGATYPFRDRLPPPPVAKTATAAVHPLPRPDLDALTAADVPFTAVLEQRRSRYRYADAPLTVGQVGAFLYRCCRIQRVVRGEAGDELAFRVYPSGGARHALEVYAAVAACDGLEQGLYRYDALTHGLEPVAGFTEDVEALLEGARRSAGQLPAYPPVLFVISARFLRTAWKYEGLPYRLILAELGALYQTMYLVATAMNLAPCALGAGDSDRFARLIGSEYYDETSVGEFILGPAAEADHA